jgi:hypothetical protein
MKTPTMKVSVTYACTTPESAMHGDHSEQGFLLEDECVTFRELVDLVKDYGVSFEHTNSDWMSSEPNVSDYRTMTYIEYGLHFCRDNPDRLWKWFLLAERVANRKSSRHA